MLASPEGTARFAARHARTHSGHWRRLGPLTVGSIGYGTYLGEASDAADAAYVHAAQRALALGCNLFDTAINYRAQRSERALGRAFMELLETGQAHRHEIVVCTKGGYLAEEPRAGAPPGTAASFALDPNLLGPGDVVDGIHAITARHLEDQLRRSLRNLKLNAVDVYYVHNPEHALRALPREEVEDRLRESFAMLERACDQGLVGRYGVATWAGLRAYPERAEHLGLERLVALAVEARKAAGGAGHHHFGVVQAPLNLAMPEALLAPTQPVRGQRMPLLDAAQALGVEVVASASLLQGRLARGLPGFVGQSLGLGSDAHRALQFARSAPGVAAALVGMGRPEHAEANLALAAEPPAKPEALRALLAAAVAAGEAERGRG